MTSKKQMSLRQWLECKKREFADRNKEDWTLPELTNHLQSGCTLNEKQKQQLLRKKEANDVNIKLLTNQGHFGSRANIREYTRSTLPLLQTSQPGLLEEIDAELAKSQTGGGFYAKHLKNLRAMITNKH